MGTLITSGLGPSGSSDKLAPSASDFAPAPGGALGRQTPVSFSVTDDSGALRLVFITAYYPALRTLEVVYAADQFGPQYQGTCSAIEGGFRYTDVLRRGGWPDAPTLRVYAADLAGNVE